METNRETIERQIDELSALKAIFGSDLRDLPKCVTKGTNITDNWSPIEVQITLKPMVSMSQLNQEVYVQIDLYVKCGKRYPNVIPDEISVKNVKGLADSVCLKLRSELYELAKSLRGEVMIFAFADHVRQCLHLHNKPPIQSFYDQMISHKTKLEIEKNLEIERQRESNRRRNELKRKELEEEMERKEMALFEESRLRRESREDIGDTLQTYTSDNFKCNLNHEMVCIAFDINGSERQIQRTKCIFHNHLKRLVDYLGIDLTNGQTFVISEWILRTNHLKRKHLTEFDSNDSNSIEDIVNRISRIETFFKNKMKCLNHLNLIRYQSVYFSIQSDHIVIDILQDHIQSTSLFNLAHIMRGQPLSLNLIRHYSKQILEVINFLHKHNCPHGDIKATNVFIDSTTGDIKISGYYLEKQFFDLYSDMNSIDSVSLSSQSLSFNINRLKMKDVFDFGLLLIAISNDWNFKNSSKLLDLKTMFSRHKTFEHFHHFIERCVDPEEDARWTPDLLLQHSFITTQNLNSIHNYSNSVESNSIALTNDRTEHKFRDEIKNNEIQTRVLLSSIASSAINSRFRNEFEVLDELGKGGFGFVFRVKNILDGRCYALKKILINPSNHSLYEKIRREVNLLSRLNHENVVRYFTSWIETEDNVDIDSSEQSSSIKTSDNLTQISLKPETKSKTANEDKKVSDCSDSDSESSSNEDVDFEAEEDIFGTSFLVEIPIPYKVSNSSSDDQYVIFERSGPSDVEEEKTPIGSSNSVNISAEEKPVRRARQYMYIQMELCAKSTLRDAIDAGLYEETHRKRRLFREIVEGLVHIHEQGVIHRDLKPGNIFLDSNDHVKIGDFGLAKEIYFIKEENSVSNSDETKINLIPDSDKNRLTGKIGTPFYVAPELTVSADINSNKIFYTQKVDIYSLGIIFFEMCYPFQTLMERTKVLINLRKKKMIFPLDVNQRMNDMEMELLQSLLEHDYTLRPSSSELLASDYLPAPEMEEKEEQNVIRRVVQNPRTKIHKNMLNMLFQRETTENEDYVFDGNEEQFGPFVRTKSGFFSFPAKQRVFQYVYSVLETIMESHSAVYISVPTLLPKHSTAIYEANDVFYVIDNTGAIASLPLDLRIPFARYVARNKISYLRRYAIEKVYRKRRFMGYHPRELWECAFDIVSPKQSGATHAIPDAEVLSVLYHLVNQFPVLGASKLTLKVNHIKLIKSILNYCEIDEELHNRVIRLIGESNSFKATQNILKESQELSSSSTSSLALKILSQRKKLLEKCVDESKVNLILQLIDLEQDSIKKLLSNIKTQMRKKGLKQQNALEMAKKALKELDLILSFAEKLGTLSKFCIRISPSFVMSGSSSALYSGFVFQLEREVKHKKSSEKQLSSVIAVGGRYDELITRFDVKINDRHLEPKGGVGLSIEFEKIMKFILDEEMKTKVIFGEVIDVVVCSLTNQNSIPVQKELCSMTKEFWNSGIKVFCFPEDLPKNIDELNAFCLENCVRYAIVLKESSDTNQTNFQITAKLFVYEKERSIDKKNGNVSDIVEYVVRAISLLKSESNNTLNVVNSEQSMISRSDSNKMIGNQSVFINESISSIGSNIRVTFITSDRLYGLPKKRHENNIISHLSTSLNFVTNNTIIEVIAIDLSFKVIKTMAAEIELDPENEEKNSWEKNKLSIIDKHLRHRKLITQVVDAVFDFKFIKKSPILCIISITDNLKFKILS